MHILSTTLTCQDCLCSVYHKNVFFIIIPDKGKKKNMWDVYEDEKKNVSVEYCSGIFVLYHMNCGWGYETNRSPNVSVDEKSASCSEGSALYHLKLIQRRVLPLKNLRALRSQRLAEIQDPGNGQWSSQEDSVQPCIERKSTQRHRDTVWWQLSTAIQLGRSIQNNKDT